MSGFEKDPPDCVIVQHGRRIIGASIVKPCAGAENHMMTGPCVLQEYRGRGLGTALLSVSLRELRDAGLSAPTVLPVTRRPRRALCIQSLEDSAGDGRLILRLRKN